MPALPLTRLPHGAPLCDYERLADALRAAHAAGEQRALELVRCLDPRFRSDAVPWLARAATAEEVAAVPFGPEEARAVVARGHDFADWSALGEWVAARTRDAAVARFEDAVEAVVGGDLDSLRRLLAAHAGLVHARSTRRTCFDPPVHRATLLHYLAANGVESERQRTPPNAVAVARTLLDAGAEPDALADFYGQPCATLSLLVSSGPPAEAGLQVELALLLVERGASIEGAGESWGTPLRTALAFGFPDAAEALARHGARVTGASDAAGLGRIELLRARLPEADADDRHLALALAAQLGRTEAVRVLLDDGVDPDRFNPEAAHPHATPLHQAVWGGHREVVALLVERGARLDLEDRIHRSTPLGWAVHGGHREIETLLRAAGT
jgi:ankyrin repeat protein